MELFGPKYIWIIMPDWPSKLWNHTNPNQEHQSDLKHFNLSRHCSPQNIIDVVNGAFTTSIPFNVNENYSIYRQEAV